MKNNKLNEIRALYRAYRTAETGKEYLKKAYEEAVENYLTLYVINYAMYGTLVDDITEKVGFMYKDYYKYGKKLHGIRQYNLTREQIRKLQDEIIVPF